MKASYQRHKDSFDATASELFGKTITITLASGKEVTGRCNDIAPSRDPNLDCLVRVEGCDDYSRSWVVQKNAA